MKRYKFKEVDKSGQEILNVINNAPRFNRWMYSEIRPFCKGRVLEIGSGIGNISEFFLNEGTNIMLSDVRPAYCDILSDKFQEHPHLLGIQILDIVDPDFDNKYAGLIGTFDTVFALNVIEHIFDHELAIQNCYKLLAPEGHFIILVPAYQTLYNHLDEALEHYRRYSRNMLIPLLQKHQFRMIQTTYFNALGILGWFITGKLQANSTIPQSQMNIYNFFVPVIRIIDMVIMRQAGLSVISVVRK